MTDRQFDSHQRNLLRYLEAAREEAKEKGVVIEKLEIIIRDIESHLTRP